MTPLRYEHAIREYELFRDGGAFESFPPAPLLGDALARAQTALLDLAEIYELHGAEALARETRCIAEMMKASDSVLSGGGASPSAKFSDGDSRSL